jgi:hypothetical protein
MTTKSDFTDEEWQGVLRTPILVGGYIATADMSTFGLISEMRGLTKAITHHPVPAAAADLVGAVIADIKADALTPESQQILKTHSNRTQNEQLLHQLGLDVEAVDRTATPDERTAFKSWLMDLAQATAEAGREGGFLGIGSVRVSEQEQEALAILHRELGLG